MAAKRVAQPLVLLTTVSSRPEAQRLSRLLLGKKLAACVNLLPGIDSWYWWQGKVTHGREILLFIKTSRLRLNRLTRLIKANHSYEVPELIALPIVWADAIYSQWLHQSMEH